ncbi:MAG: thiamine phosphate synthase [Betaproteobacteria bacterium]
MTRRISGLYAVTPDALDDAPLLAKVDAALKGGARLVQYRNKSADASVRSRQARALLALCHRHGVPLIVNDHARLAAAIGADGLHIGRGDGDIAQARAMLGSQALIGASCYDRLDSARAAAAAGASYVAFGSFFPSDVKPNAVRPPLDLLRQAKREIGLPVVAIGGINRTNAGQLIAAGADSIAVISAVFSAADVRAAAAELDQLFAGNPE